MTWLIVGIIAALLFVVAGTAPMAIRAFLRGRADDARRGREEAQNRRAAEAEEQVRRRAEADARMRHAPVPVLVATLADYVERVRIPRNAAANAANVVLQERESEFRTEREQLPASLREPGTTRYAVLAAVPLFVLGSLVAGVLDFLTFRGFSGGMLLPALLSVLTVLIMTVASVLIGLGMGWHKGLAGADWSRFRRGVVARLGVVVAVAGLIAMVWVAPNRTAGYHERVVAQAKAAVTRYRTMQPQSEDTRAKAETATQEVKKAEADQRLAAAVDRVSVGGITILEIPLTEGMLFGVQVLMCVRAQRRRDEAARAHRQALDAIERGDSRIRADMLEVLATYGHGIEPLREALVTLEELNMTWTGLLDRPALNPPPPAEPDATAGSSEPLTQHTDPEPDQRTPAHQMLDGLDEMGTQPRGAEGKA